LANRLSFPFAKYICLTFQETTRFFKNKQKLIVTGTPIRPALLTGNAEKGRAFCQFNRDKPMLLILGGGLGAEKVNLAIRAILAILLNHFQIVHVCGKGKIDATCQHEGYKQFDYLNEELADVLASSDIVVSRAGANSIYELLALKKTTLLIPLSRRASRGDQIVNAHYCEKQGFMKVLVEENLNSNILLQTILNLYQEKTTLEKQMMNYQLPDSVQLIYDAISQASS
jgi:UDP-N-acetylglucosamine--N-acetylmuramyl-(pentapeptide) pyrophosphoryl-undecaprenol N-acetylglucosamine transferase